jgi:mRNA interferase RelE/StbE
VAYLVQFTPAAAKALAGLDRGAQRRILAKVEGLASNPRPAGVKALQGEEGIYRLRVGDYRILYAVRDRELVVLVVDVGHRREIYRR